MNQGSDFDREIERLEELLEKAHRRNDDLRRSNEDYQRKIQAKRQDIEITRTEIQCLRSEIEKSMDELNRCVRDLAQIKKEQQAKTLEKQAVERLHQSWDQRLEEQSQLQRKIERIKQIVGKASLVKQELNPNNLETIRKDIGQYPYDGTEEAKTTWIIAFYEKLRLLLP